MTISYLRNRNWIAAGLLLAAVVLAACSPSDAAEVTPAGTAPGYPGPGTPFGVAPTAAYPLPTQGGAPAPTAAVSGPVEALVAQAVSDLAQRAGADPASITVVEASPQSWPDASLGCPIEGQIYAQVITDGYRIVLEAGGQRYAYHTDQERASFCEQDKP